MRIAWALLGLVLVAALPAHAEVVGETGYDLLDKCALADRALADLGVLGDLSPIEFAEVSSCLGTLNGIVGVSNLQQLAKDKGRKLRQVCIPDGFPMELVVRAVIMRLREYPELRDLDIGGAAYLALAAHFPCP